MIQTIKYKLIAFERKTLTDSKGKFEQKLTNLIKAISDMTDMRSLKEDGKAALGNKIKQTMAAIAPEVHNTRDLARVFQALSRGLTIFNSQSSSKKKGVKKKPDLFETACLNGKLLAFIGIDDQIKTQFYAKETDPIFKGICDGFDTVSTTANRVVPDQDIMLARNLFRLKTWAKGVGGDTLDQILTNIVTSMRDETLVDVFTALKENMDRLGAGKKFLRQLNIAKLQPPYYPTPLFSKSVSLETCNSNWKPDAKNAVKQAFKAAFTLFVTKQKMRQFCKQVNTLDPEGANPYGEDHSFEKEFLERAVLLELITNKQRIQILEKTPTPEYQGYILEFIANKAYIGVAFDDGVHGMAQADFIDDDIDSILSIEHVTQKAEELAIAARVYYDSFQKGLSCEKAIVVYAAYTTEQTQLEKQKQEVTKKQKFQQAQSMKKVRIRQQAQSMKKGKSKPRHTTKVTLSRTYRTLAPGHPGHTDKVERHLNRYHNILPGVSTLVRLRYKRAGRNTGGYINANTITGLSRQEYIATQGPMDETAEDFWYMVDEKNTEVVVMTTDLIEKGRQKCAPYFPTAEDRCKTFGEITVNFLANEQSPLGYQVSTFELIVPGKPSKTITHFWYDTWPDHGVPESDEGILDMLHKVNGTNTRNKPIVIHCSAGIGRTGTFLAIDDGHRLIKQNQPEVDVSEIVRNMRNQRPLMIQTGGQYLLACQAISRLALEDGNQDESGLAMPATTLHEEEAPIPDPPDYEVSTTPHEKEEEGSAPATTRAPNLVRELAANLASEIEQIQKLAAAKKSKKVPPAIPKRTQASLPPSKTTRAEAPVTPTSTNTQAPNLDQVVPPTRLLTRAKRPKGAQNRRRPGRRPRVARQTPLVKPTTVAELATPPPTTSRAMQMPQTAPNPGKKPPAPPRANKPPLVPTILTEKPAAYSATGKRIPPPTLTKKPHLVRTVQSGKTGAASTKPTSSQKRAPSALFQELQRRLKRPPETDA